MRATVIIEDELFGQLQVLLKDFTLSQFINLSLEEFLKNHKSVLPLLQQSTQENFKEIYRVLYY